MNLTETPATSKNRKLKAERLYEPGERFLTFSHQLVKVRKPVTTIFSLKHESSELAGRLERFNLQFNELLFTESDYLI